MPKLTLPKILTNTNTHPYVIVPNSGHKMTCRSSMKITIQQEMDYVFTRTLSKDRKMAELKTNIARGNIRSVTKKRKSQKKR